MAVHMPQNRPRKVTVGPLDAPLDIIGSVSDTPTTEQPDPLSDMKPLRAALGEDSLTSESQVTEKDYRSLVDEKIFQEILEFPLPQPLADEGLPQQPKDSDDSTLANLIRCRKYLTALQFTQKGLLSTEPVLSSLPDIFSLWQTRLRLFDYLRLPQLAIQELSLLPDIVTPGPEFLNHDGRTLVLWSLRVEIVRVKALAAQNQVLGWEIAIKEYYALSTEARGELARAKRASDAEHAALWAERLEGLGFAVLSALIAIRDYPTAIHQLQAMLASTPLNRKLHTALCLTYLHVGNVASARTYPGEDSSLLALVSMADGQWSDATGAAALDEAPSRVLNHIVAALYRGNIEESTTQLRSLLSSTNPVISSTTLESALYNLCTINELRTMGTDLKKQLATEYSREFRESGRWEVFKV
ncbi:hypothetical protein YB2330_006402 [Saitoella coloradoensis]